MNRQERRGQLKSLQKLTTSATDEITEAMRIAHQHHMHGELGIAEKIYLEVLKIQPNHTDALMLMGMICHEKKDKVASLRYLNKAIFLDKQNFLYHYHKGVVHQDYLEFKEAISAFSECIRLKKDFIEGYLGLGVAHEHLKHIKEATEFYEHALSLQPIHAAACNNLATLYRDESRIDEALELYKRALAQGNDPVIHSNFLLCLNYDSAQTPDTLRAAHQEWDTLYAAPYRASIQPHVNIPAPNKRLKIGYISSDFKQHPVADFLLPALENHQKDHVEIYCYASIFNEDAMTARLKKAAHHWRDILRMSPPAIANQIRADGIDILVDLGGHTAGNHLLVFAYKPAPIQISWLGYFNTTGMQTMDYFISDSTHIPEGKEQGFTEEILRLPDAYIAYMPPASAPSVKLTLPLHEQGYVTFGSFNNTAKLNKHVISLWAEILKQVPNARLILKAKAFGSKRICDSYRQQFRERGIEETRIELLGWSSPEELYALYNNIDIALDPFPFSGGATSCNALWMGVPVITLRGETAVSRQTATYLTQLGLTELITETKEEYIQCALSLSQNTGKLSALRNSLRESMASSPLCNGKRFTANLEEAYRKAWQRWCEKRA